MATKDSKLKVEDIEKLFTYKDGNFYWKINTGRVKAGDLAGGSRPDGYKVIGINHTYYFIHRLVFFYHKGYFPKFVDHINGNKGDNRIENLREATKSQNGQNRKVSKNSVSGIKGVTWVASRKNWKAQISVDNKKYYLGQFKNLEDAKKCVIEVREKLAGIFAKHQ